MKNKGSRVGLLALVAAVVLGLGSSLHGAVQLDPTFGASLIQAPSGRAYVSLVQPDGKIITHGTFVSTNGQPSSNLIRLNADGSTDFSFNAQRVGDTSIRAIGLQSDGKIIIAGYFTMTDSGGNAYRGIARLHQNGALDTTFVGDATIPSILQDLLDINIQPDDSIIVGGNNGFAKLLQNGNIDAGFGPTNRTTKVFKMAMQPDGKILYSSSWNLKRFNADGSNDPTFPETNFSAQVMDIKRMPDGKILVGGSFTHVNGFVRPQLCRFNADGNVDATFVNTWMQITALIQDIIPLPDGKALVLGGLNTVQQNQGVHRLNTDGSIDTTFVAIPEGGYDMDLQADGRIIVSTEIEYPDRGPTLVHRLSTEGALDGSFGGNLGLSTHGLKIFVQPDGKLLVGGPFTYVNNLARVGLGRFNTDGSADASLSPVLPSDAAVTAIDRQPDGNFIVNSPTGTQTARRLKPDGSLDTVFVGTPQATDVRVLGNGQILISGNAYLKRFNADGSLDAAFAPAINNRVAKFAVQPDGKVVIVGEFTQVNGQPRGRVARINTDGSLDLTFDTSTGASNEVRDVFVQPDGKVVIGGRFSGVNFVQKANLARLNPDGSLDTPFNPAASSDVDTLKLQPNGKILVGGLFLNMNGTSRQRIARLHPDGTLDQSLNLQLTSPQLVSNPRVRDIEVQSDGSIVMVGDFISVNGTRKLGIARLFETPSRNYFDYDGDSKADVSVFRPSENKWYVFRSSDAVVYQPIFALTGDVPVPADYDGDGKTDVAIFRPSAGDWWYLASSDGTQRSVHWGASGDVPRPSDFDGDGKADFIVFRPGENNWYRLGSTGLFSAVNFGLAGDKPVTGDFDGDGKTDVAIYRPSTGDWWWKSSIDGVQRATHFGISSDTPAPADYDGDGKTDFAVYRASIGVWYILNTGNGSTIVSAFGLSEDKPVAADYDGDGKADIAVFRPSSGVWYLLRSAAGFTAMQFGISTDTPTPNAFVP